MITELVSSFVAIIVAMVALIKIVGNAELIVNALSLTFGVMAVIWVVKARKSLSEGSSLRTLTTHFLFTLIFVLCFSSWNLLVDAMALEEIYGTVIAFPQYLFISLTYITFVGTAYKIRKLGQEFGFSKQSKKISELLKKKEEKDKKK